MIGISRLTRPIIIYSNAFVKAVLLMTEEYKIRRSNLFLGSLEEKKRD